jgi:sirohydrochlorin cobaltochelatase
MTERVTTEQARTERVTTEQARTERVTTEQARTERVTTEQARTERVTTEQATTEQATTERATTEQALIIAGHGSHRNPDSAAPVHRAVAAAREEGSFAEVRPAFWKESPSFREVLHTVDADEAIVVPLFVSEGYFVQQVLPREFGLGIEDRGDDAPTLRYADPIGTHPEMTEVIAARARRMLAGEYADVPSADAGGAVSTDDAALAVVGHGTERNPNSAEAVYDHVETLREEYDFAEVGALFMDEAPYVEDVLDEFSADKIAVVPLFTADGFHTRDEIPELLGLTDDPTTGYPVPGTVEGRQIWYSSAVGTDPLVADVVVERAAEAGGNVNTDANGRRFVRQQAGETFVSWVEQAGDESGDAARGFRDFPNFRDWGELALGATAEETESDRPRNRSYHLRHRSDRDAPASDLESVSVGGLREELRYADDGRYRPFSGEETLPTGWVCAGLDREEFLRAVSTVYPAGVERWAADRAGDLDPVPFRAVADRQTGIYDCVSDCSPEEVSGTIEAACGNCAKRRAWGSEGESPEAKFDEETALPCREPCSFLVAAAREFHQHEGEAAGGDATSGDAERDASTADRPTESDPSVPRGDATDPANVYRVRYRRARDGQKERPEP